jgi:hypothetical protein
MSKRRTQAELDGLLKFVLGLTLGAILFFTTMGILYALVFVEQPLNGQSENDKMFFNVLGSVATFITGNTCRYFNWSIWCKRYYGCTVV